MTLIRAILSNQSAMLYCVAAGAMETFSTLSVMAPSWSQPFIPLP